MQPGADVPAQVLPIGAVVAGPTLRIALHARWPAPADAEHRFGRSLRRPVPGLRFEAGARHQQRMQGPRPVHGQRLTKASAAGAIVHDGVLVVVVPSSVNSKIQHLALQAGLPPGDHRRVREIQVRADTIPKLLDHGRGGGGVMDKAPLGAHLVPGGVIIKQAGLDVGHQSHTCLVEARIERLRVRKLVVVPGKHIAALAA